MEELILGTLLGVGILFLYMITFDQNDNVECIIMVDS